MKDPHFKHSAHSSWKIRKTETLWPLEVLKINKIPIPDCQEIYRVSERIKTESQKLDQFVGVVLCKRFKDDGLTYPGVVVHAA